MLKNHLNRYVNLTKEKLEKNNRTLRLQGCISHLFPLPWFNLSLLYNIPNTQPLTLG